MIAQSFEIKIALLGNVSVGKTTVLNALFRDKYGEVSRKRTTVGANFFHVHNKKQLSEADPRPADSILKEITEDNRRLRESDYDSVQEKHFDVDLPEQLMPMAENTKLVFIDIPGINEAGTDNKYKEYVCMNWHTFDCVVVVLDGKADVRTDDQIFLLNLVKENLTKRYIPIIILCNKVDCPENEEQKDLVRNACKEIKNIFHGSNPDASLTYILRIIDENNQKLHPISSLISPVFIPLSAIQAFTYQTASLMDYDRFKQSFDERLVEEFGRELFGKIRWSELSSEEKYKEVHDTIQNPKNHSKGIEDCNFDHFLTALSFMVGGKERQGQIMRDQIKIGLKTIGHGISDCSITSQLASIYSKTRCFGDEDRCNERSLIEAFWTAYNELEDSAFMNFESAWVGGLRPFSRCDLKVQLLETPMQELILFHGMCRVANWDDERAAVIHAMKGLIRRLIAFLVMQEKKDAKSSINVTPRGLGLSPFDWKLIKGSILLLSYDRHFCEQFGQEKLMLEAFQPLLLNSEPMHRFQSLVDFCYDRSSKTIVPSSPQQYQTFVSVEVPESLADPRHFGHIVWRFCSFMKSLETSGKVSQIDRDDFFEGLVSNTKLPKAHQFCTVGNTSGNVKSPSPSTTANISFGPNSQSSFFSGKEAKRQNQLPSFEFQNTTSSSSTRNPNTSTKDNLAPGFATASTPFERSNMTAATASPPFDQGAARNPFPCSSWNTGSNRTPNSSTAKALNSPPFGGSTLRNLLYNFYQQRNPSKLAKIDDLLAKYKGREEQMLRMLAKKYNVDPCVFGLSSSPGTSFASAQTTTAASPDGSATAANGMEDSRRWVFKKEEGGWTCGVCLVNNGADRTVCVSCATARCGPSVNWGSPAAFSFGSTNIGYTGSGATNQSSSQSPTSGFSFGGANSAPDPSSFFNTTGRFSFGGTSSGCSGSGTSNPSPLFSTTNTFSFGGTSSGCPGSGAPNPSSLFGTTNTFSFRGASDKGSNTTSERFFGAATSPGAFSTY